MKLKYIFLAILTLSIATNCDAKSKKNKGNYGAYVYGLASSFNDSIVYITDIQRLDSAWIDNKGFLYGREEYSLQLRSHFIEDGKGQRTCAISFASKQKKIEKKYLNAKKRLTRKKTYVDIQYVPSNTFNFIQVIPDEEGKLKSENLRKQQKERRKAEKKSKKEMKKGLPLSAAPGYERK